MLFRSVVRVERDLTAYGDECKFGGGKVLRDRMGQAEGVPDAEALDCVITGALVIDWTGIYKADLGIRPPDTPYTPFRIWSALQAANG